MRHKVSEAWLDLGYGAPDNTALNAQMAEARLKERKAWEKRKAEREALPVRRTVARGFFARMHAVVEDAGNAH